MVPKAAELGIVEAQFNMCCSYYHGGRLRQSTKEAVWWFREVAEQGNAQAQQNLGEMYAEGEGVRRSFEEAAV